MITAHELCYVGMPSPVRICSATGRTCRDAVSHAFDASQWKAVQQFPQLQSTHDGIRQRESPSPGNVEEFGGDGGLVSAAFERVVDF